MSKDTNITNQGVPATVETDLVDYAPWNPRPEITEDDVRELAQSIKDKGLLNRVSLVPNPDRPGRYIVFAGNRRLAAFRLAYGGDGQIPAEVFEITIAEAKVLTALENLQRKDVEPLREAALVEECLDSGMTGEEIAAKVGKSAAWVTRRRKLIGLEPTIREAAEARPDHITTDALENIAIYPPEIQKKLAKEIRNRMNYGRVTWNDVGHLFRSRAKDLDAATFVRRAFGPVDCATCPNRTGAQADLFGEVKEGSLGSCLDEKCYKRHAAEWQRAAIDAAVPKTVKDRVVVKYAWDVPSEANGKKPTKAKPCAYIFVDWSGEVHVTYGPTEATLEARRARAEENEKAAKSARAEIAKRMQRLLRNVSDGFTDEELGDYIKKADRNLVNWDFVGKAVLDLICNVDPDCHHDVFEAIMALPPSAVKELGIEDEIKWVESIILDPRGGEGEEEA